MHRFFNPVSQKKCKYIINCINLLRLLSINYGIGKFLMRNTMELILCFMFNNIEWSILQNGNQ